MDGNIDCITLEVLNSCTEELNEARKVGYCNYSILNDYKEVYDDHSWHIVALTKKKIISSVRITPFPLSPIHDWTDNEIMLPLIEGTINVTKGFTLPDFHNKGIFRAVFPYSLLFCKKMGFKQAIGAYKKEGETKRFTNRLGFEEIKQIFDFSVPPYRGIDAIPIICDLNKKHKNYLNEFNNAIQFMKENGVNVRIGKTISNS